MRLAFVAPLLLLAGAQDPPAPPAPVDFVRDVLPVFKASCHKCHGVEKPRGQLRLDARALALRGGVSGKVILPGRAAESRLVQLLQSADPEERMPSKAAPLPKEKIDLIRAWIDQGAEWPEAASADAAVERHWAHVKPVRPALPAVGDAGAVRNPVDAFILARLEREGLAPSPEAPKEKLLRRASLDLIGLPPGPAELDAFLADAAPDAYERAVDRLLASPRYGERWARPWLDLARYADTNGFNIDSRRTMWMYRDWVIRALNADMPFDAFTVDQIAGDMLPGATLDQRIASGFHRNTMLNEEGGVDREEARWETLLDRVNTTTTVWLGATIACAQCHNHKYDPFSQKDYYRLLAFFDNADEPTVEAPTPEQEKRRAGVKAEIERLEKLLAAQTPELDAAQAAWERKPGNVPGDIRALLDVPPERRSAKEKAELSAHHRTIAPALKPARDRLAALKRDLKALPVDSALVMRERAGSERPSTDLRIRGSFVARGERVPADVPASLHPLPPGASANRLGLARWLVSGENPLVARVTVNRLWEQLFGRGLVGTPEDFGLQGERPIHPELLDWLAVEFMERGWSQKAILRTMATSAAYRRSSRVTAEHLRRDPENRLLARGPRFRLEAEQLRDAALSAAGLLSGKIGGPSVFPLQADMSGVIPINKTSMAWTPSAGEDLHRRGLYTYWRRTMPFAAFTSFDAPSRECCTVRRTRTNTPLQALSALNDPGFFDAARGLARRALAEGGADDRSRAAYAFRLCTARWPDPGTLDRLIAALEREREHFRANAESARAVAGSEELAAWTLVANVLLNLDETLTRE